MEGGLDALLATGNAGLMSGDWAAAKVAFEAALEQEDMPEAMFGLGDTLWWLGDIERAIRCRERAYAGFRRRPDPAQAAIAAMRLCVTYRANIGNHAASRGWAARAVRLVEDFQIEPLRGWALLTRALVAEDAATGEALAREAHGIARRSGDADLELCALSEIGAWLVEAGKIREGVSLLDEAMAGSLGGEGGSLNTVVYTSCHTLISCSRAAEFQHAAQWIRALDDFSGRYGCPFLHTMCRTVYGTLLFVAGEWAQAEAQYKAAQLILAAASGIGEKERSFGRETPPRVVGDLPRVTVWIDHDRGVSAPERVGRLAAHFRARRSGSAGDRVDVVGRCDAVRQGHAAPSAAVSDTGVRCELGTVPEGDDHLACLEEHGLLAGSTHATPAERLVETARPLLVSHAERDEAHPLLHLRLDGRVVLAGDVTGRGALPCPTAGRWCTGPSYRRLRGRGCGSDT